MAKRVFLGGTCNGSMWRKQMIVHLQERGLDWFCRALFFSLPIAII